MKLLARIDELRQRKTIPFKFHREGIQYDGFLLWHEGQVFAYENRCRHIPISLDYGDGHFLSGDEKYIVCQTHGATYEPETGKCISGPCVGARLTTLPIEVNGAEIFLKEIF